MSRPKSTPVASRTAFDVLAVDDPYESEEEEVVEVPPPEPEPVPQPSPKPQPQPLSKSAQKRAAKAARSATPVSKKGSKTGLAAAAAAQPSDPAEPTSASHAAEAKGASGDSPSQTPTPPSELESPEPTVVAPTSSLPVPRPLPQRSSRSRSPPGHNGTIPTAESPFSPFLPTSLPHPPSPGLVRKRKASADLTSNPLTKESKVEVAREGGNGEDVVVATVPLSIAVSSSADAESQVAAKAAAEKSKKMRNAGTRIVWSLVMIAGFLATLLAGHAWMIVLVLVCQTMVYREVTALFGLSYAPQAGTSGSSDKKIEDPWSKTLNWYFFAVANYFLYGESIIYYFKHVVFAGGHFVTFAMSHRFISFMLYMFGFMGFVASLKKNHLRRQFGLFCWVHMSLLVIVVSSHFIVNNILEGLIWFWVPASLVICNDCFAYIWGVTLGRTPLFKLSPKKTVEGFVGAFFSTLLFGLLWGTLFMRYDYMICPLEDLGTSAWTARACTPNPVFVWREWNIPKPVQVLIYSIFHKSITHIPYATYQFHVLVMACFASLVAPFGGFFASGFKRAFDLKDFGHSIPGHGGITDRMDCQFLMGMFSYVYYSSLIRAHAVTVGGVLQTIVSGLTLEEQLELFHDLRQYLEGRGALTAA